jgi:hypothetical protein
MVIMDDSVAEIKVKDEEREERPTEVASTMAVSVKRLERGRKRLHAVAKPIRRWLIVIYKQVLALVRRAFKMVTNLEQVGGADQSSDNVIQDMIENTRIWLVDQIGKHFPRERHGYLLKRWQKLEPLFQNLVNGLGGKKKVRSLPAVSSLVAPSAVAPSASPPSPPSPPIVDE